MSDYNMAYVKFYFNGSVVGYGWIITRLWPTKSAVSWEAVDPVKHSQEMSK